MPPDSEPDLFVIGLGVMVPGHVTVQATRAMTRCSRLFSIVQEPTHLWLPEDRVGRIDVVNALRWYEEDNLRTQNYDRVARRIFESLSPGQTLGYVTYGNPMAYDRVAQHLADYAREVGFAVQIIPGISSLDTVFCDLQVDLAPGLQVFEASWLVVCQIQPRTDIALLLMQVGVFGSLRTHYTKRQDGKSLSGLADCLLSSYPTSHLVSLVRSTGVEGQPSNIRQVALKDLCTVSSEDLSGASLYVPPVAKSRPNQEILNRMLRR